MSSSSRNISFTLGSIVIVAAIIAGMVNAGCASKPRAVVPAAPVNAGESDFGNSDAPGAKTFKERDLPGKAYAIDGSTVQARAIITNGESRRPLFLDATTIAYSTHRASVERWQVFAADLTKKIERRISFDAGDATPVTVLGSRMVIASSSDERKSGDRVLTRYQAIFIPKESEQTPLIAPETSAQHLMLEHPAVGHKGTEWNRISPAPAREWIFSADRALKQAIAIGLGGETPLIFKVAITGKPNDPIPRMWVPLQVAIPAGASGKIIDGRFFPDGTRILWSNGAILWTTNAKGGEPVRIGDDKIPGASSLAIDPSGQWIVFSSATGSNGLNLMALHQSGRCLKTLTDISGDEIDPTFSPDGQRLLFIEKQGDSSAVAEIPFGTAAVATAACP